MLRLRSPRSSAKLSFVLQDSCNRDGYDDPERDFEEAELAVTQAECAELMSITIATVTHASR